VVHERLVVGEDVEEVEDLLARLGDLDRDGDRLHRPDPRTPAGPAPSRRDAATFAFTEVFATEGLAFNLALMAFIFLVAIGVDYNIFLMTRAREEAALRGTREGMLDSLVTTGGVVTGAGVILAGTFATLTLLPLEELVQIGATVAVGVLLDTFVVRALLVPSITCRLGDRAWWPGRPRPADRGAGRDAAAKP
jgi:RND superfamily putative drug exporter